METLEARFYTVPKVADSGELRQAIALQAGGFTVTYGEGGWVNGAGQLVVEPQATIEVVGDRATVALVSLLVRDQAKTVGEEAVLVTTKVVTQTMMEVGR